MDPLFQRSSSDKNKQREILKQKKKKKNSEPCRPGRTRRGQGPSSKHTKFEHNNKALPQKGYAFLPVGWEKTRRRASRNTLSPEGKNTAESMEGNRKKKIPCSSGRRFQKIGGSNR